MSLVDCVAAAMYNASDPSEPEAENAQWPPSHPDDRAWWITRAQAAIDAIGAPEPRPCHLPHSAPPCIGCKCGAEVPEPSTEKRSLTDEIRDEFAFDDMIAPGSLSDLEKRAEFDRWLESVKAEAWDEGREGGIEDLDTSGYGGIKERANPYRKEGAQFRRPVSPEPQGEPSDADLSKLANDAHHTMVAEAEADGGWYGFSHSRDAWEDGFATGYRASAASAVTEQGENR